MRPIRLLSLLALCAVAGCESDARTLKRLKQHELLTSVDVRFYARRFDSLTRIGDTGAAYHAYADSMTKAETAHDLAVRDLNRFMH